ncbi:hypothetical protein MUA03_17525 [Enterobacteriaceae bacterium H16N7]|nr:hypothetical protein [Dryocola clanedunensis]
MAVAALASFPALASTGAIPKTNTAPTIRIFSAGTAPTALDNFSVTSTDFKSGELSATKTLTLVRFSVAAYPAALTDMVKLCYYRPYAASWEKCIDVTPGTSSTTAAFNSYIFGNGSKLQLRHDVTGTAGDQLQPSRQESVTFEYSY